MSLCGNNVVDSGETCDDGDQSDASECNSTCTGNVVGWSCTGGSPSTNSTCVAALCGDSMVIDNEVCDDGTDDNFGCATGCLSINPLYICPTAGGPTTASVCNLKCSNSNLEEGEECDDSNIVDGDGCS